VAGATMATTIVAKGRPCHHWKSD